MITQPTGKDTENLKPRTRPPKLAIIEPANNAPISPTSTLRFPIQIPPGRASKVTKKNVTTLILPELTIIMNVLKYQAHTPSK